MIEMLNNLCKQLMQYKDFEPTLRKYISIIAQQAPQMQIEWQPKLTLLISPTRSESYKFEIYNWLLVYVQLKMSTLIQVLPNQKIVENLREALGVLSYLLNSKEYDNYYDLNGLNRALNGLINYSLCRLMDENDDPHFYNQNAKTPYEYIYSTVILSVEQLINQKFQDKVLNNVVQICRIIQQARILYLAGAKSTDIQTILLEMNNSFELPSEIVQVILENTSSLFYKLLCTQMDQNQQNAYIDILRSRDLSCQRQISVTFQLLAHHCMYQQLNSPLNTIRPIIFIPYLLSQNSATNHQNI
ncbi:Hypothetical_protein [Hexamita inflata]|uniref:Hypothetical_protein n=1 Tax=Hexamita inflata TaxID=28002 RepID=A0AA86UCE3_9EUKA|nr:Hypothetical protein HINF_LOCUS37784 [Hexamita inflata]